MIDPPMEITMLLINFLPNGRADVQALCIVINYGCRSRLNYGFSIEKGKKICLSPIKLGLDFIQVELKVRVFQAAIPNGKTQVSSEGGGTGDANVILKESDRGRFHVFFEVWKQDFSMLMD